ncbi:hypothetical protein RUND412_009793 [Rhizina undulata]
MGMNLERYLLVHGISASPVPEASAPPQALTNNNYNEECTPMEWELTGRPQIVILPPAHPT